MGLRGHAERYEYVVAYTFVHYKWSAKQGVFLFRGHTPSKEYIMQRSCVFKHECIENIQIKGMAASPVFAASNAMRILIRPEDHFFLIYRT